MKIISQLLVATTCFMIMGCVTTPVKLHNMAVKVQDQKEQGEWYIVKEVRHGDILKVTASFIWPEPTPAGRHTFRWEIHQGGEVVTRLANSSSTFISSPTGLYLDVDSSALKLGDCECILYLDDVERGRVNIKIVSRNPMRE